jgi:hypothetical protein
MTKIFTFLLLLCPEILGGAAAPPYLLILDRDSQNSLFRI